MGLGLMIEPLGSPSPNVTLWFKIGSSTEFMESGGKLGWEAGLCPAWGSRLWR